MAFSFSSFYLSSTSTLRKKNPTFSKLAKYLSLSLSLSLSLQVGASYAYVHAATLIATVVGGPLAAAILAIGDRAGLESWRWLFIIEGIFPMLLSLWIFTLPCSPATAKFLTAQQRAELTQSVIEARGGTCGGGATAKPPKFAEIRDAAWATLLNWRLWCVGLLELIGSSGRFGVQFFTPLIIERLLEERLGKSITEKKTAGAVAASAALSAIPFGLAAVGAVVNAAVAKRCHHRKWFIVWPGIVCALGLGVLGPLIERSGTGAFLALVAGAMGFAGYGVVMSLPSTLVGSSRTESALGYAHFTMLAMLGGFVGPTILGAITQGTGGFTLGASILGGDGAAFVGRLLLLFSFFSLLTERQSLFFCTSCVWSFVFFSRRIVGREARARARRVVGRGRRRCHFFGER